MGKITMLDQQAALAGLQILPRDHVEVVRRHIHYTLDAQRRLIQEMGDDLYAMRKALQTALATGTGVVEIRCTCAGVRAKEVEVQG